MAAPKGNKNAIGNTGGAPSKYKPEFAEQVYKLALLGATDKELSDFFDISESTLNGWKKDKIEFLESINKGKLKADAEVAESLFKRATGITYDEVTYEKIIVDKNGIDDEENIKVDMYKKKVVTKLLAPDVAAQNIWLKNRRAKSKVKEGAQHWADKQETGLTDVEGNDVPAVMFYLPDNGRTITKPENSGK